MFACFDRMPVVVMGCHNNADLKIELPPVTIKPFVFRYFQKQLLLLRISRKGDKDPQKEEVISMNYWVIHPFFKCRIEVLIL